MFKFWYLMVVLNSGQEQFVVNNDRMVRFSNPVDCQVQVIKLQETAPHTTYKCREVKSMTDLSRS